MLLCNVIHILLRDICHLFVFKKQLDLFVRWLRTGEEPVDFADTVEMMKIVIAGIRSREEGGRVVYLDEIN